MPKIRYEQWTPNPVHRSVIDEAARIAADYAGRGLDLTLRQMYYRFVAGDLFPADRKFTQRGGKWVKDEEHGTNNAEPNYKWLGDLLNRARLAGMIDWYHMVDRTRGLAGNQHWDTPEQIIEAATRGFRVDKHATAKRRIEVWVEKEALVGIVGRVARRRDVDYFACKGYVSQSEQWSAARRHLGYLLGGQAVTVLYLGDHDPSGIDMTRDVRDRIEAFVSHDYWAQAPGLRSLFPAGAEPKVIMDEVKRRLRTDSPIEIKRIALNMDQVEQYDPPPNPTKLSDSRANDYIAEFGEDCWELDALDPDVLDALIDRHVDELMDHDAYDEAADHEREELRKLGEVQDRWAEIVEYIRRTSEDADDAGEDDD